MMQGRGRVLAAWRWDEQDLLMVCVWQVREEDVAGPTPTFSAVRV